MVSQKYHWCINYQPVQRLSDVRIITSYQPSPVTTLHLWEPFLADSLDVTEPDWQQVIRFFLLVLTGHYIYLPLPPLLSSTGLVYSRAWRPPQLTCYAGQQLDCAERLLIFSFYIRYQYWASRDHTPHTTASTDHDNWNLNEFDENRN